VFFGSGAIGISLLGRVPRPINYWFNDLDPVLASWWFAVRDYPNELIAAVIACQPNQNQFSEIKEWLASIYQVPETAEEIVEIALAKLVLNQCCFYGFGAGLRVGTHQAGFQDNRIGARWRPQESAAKIRAISGHFRLRNVRLSQRQCWYAIEHTERLSLLYLDPPYLGMTPSHMRKFTLQDHKRLAETLRRSPYPFAMSHRINAKIRDLYTGWAEISEIDAVDYLITRWQ